VFVRLRVGSDGKGRNVRDRNRRLSGSRGAEPNLRQPGATDLAPALRHLEKARADLYIRRARRRLQQA
jgi:hypothetical protein